MGIELDADANAAGAARISRTGSRVSAWTIATNEELMIATHTAKLLGSMPDNRETRECCHHVCLRSYPCYALRFICGMSNMGVDRA